MPESVESLSQYHMPGDVRDLPRRKQHFICAKKESENFPSRRVSVDVLCNLMYKFFLSFYTLLLVCLKMFEQFILNVLKNFLASFA